MRSRLLAAALLLLAAPAAAVDGRIELNQQIVGAAGTFPYVISRRGSYVLTGDLDIPTGQSGLRIEADDVAIDLNGFAIRSGYDCAGSGCAPGAGIGVEAGVLGPELARRTTLRNGSVQGFGSTCVSLGADALVERLIVTSCGQDGVFLLERGLALGNRISASGLFGLRLISPGSFSDNVLAFNGLGTGPGGAVAGGTDGGGNVCDAGRCRQPGRRYYLTTSLNHGDTADTSCSLGFHMASLTELSSPGALVYDDNLGRPSSDGPGGPPPTFGWLRTGGSPSGSTTPGVGNCLGWSSSSCSDSGSAAASANWSGATSPWSTASPACCDSVPVWCIED